MSNSFYHKDLTEAQWSRIKFVFEEPAKVGRPPRNPRTVFNAVMWILKSGARWRDLPTRYGNLEGIKLDAPIFHEKAIVAIIDSGNGRGARAERSEKKSPSGNET